MNGCLDTVAASGGAGGTHVLVDAAGMGLPVASGASKVTFAAKPLPPALDARPYVHTLRVDGRAADSPRLAARVRASVQRGRQNIIDNVRRAVEAT